MPDRRLTTPLAALLLGCGLALAPTAAEADRDRGRHGGWQRARIMGTAGHGGWGYRPPAVIVVPPPVYRPPPVVVIPGYAVPYGYGYGPGWGYGPHGGGYGGGGAEFSVRIPFR